VNARLRSGAVTRIQHAARRVTDVVPMTAMSLNGVECFLRSPDRPVPSSSTGSIEAQAGKQASDSCRCVLVATSGAASPRAVATCSRLKSRRCTHSDDDTRHDARVRLTSHVTQARSRVEMFGDDLLCSVCLVLRLVFKVACLWMYKGSPQYVR
jgi:hypothetical protein